MDIVTLAAAKAYANNLANALGAVKGAPCTIKSITAVDDGQEIVFQWTGTDGTVQTATMLIPNGAVDEKARSDIAALSEGKADKAYMVALFEELKALILSGDTESAVALLDHAILDNAVLA